MYIQCPRLQPVLPTKASEATRSQHLLLAFNTTSISICQVASSYAASIFSCETAARSRQSTTRRTFSSEQVEYLVFVREGQPLSVPDLFLGGRSVMGPNETRRAVNSVDPILLDLSDPLADQPERDNRVCQEQNNRGPGLAEPLSCGASVDRSLLRLTPLSLPRPIFPSLPTPRTGQCLLRLTRLLHTQARSIIVSFSLTSVRLFSSFPLLQEGSASRPVAPCLNPSSTRAFPLRRFKSASFFLRL